MAFQVFPNEMGNSHQQPLAVAAGNDSGLKPLGPFPASGTKFVRVAVSGGGTHPQFSLVAGTGAEKTIPEDVFTHPVYPTLDETSEEAGDVNLAAQANSVFLLTISLDLAASWQLRIKNVSGVTQSYVWVVGDSDLESQQPWLNVSANNPMTGLPYAFRVLPGQQETFALAVTNFGTGIANLVTGAPLGAGFAVTLPAPIVQGGTDNVSVTYTGVALPGQIVPTYTVTASPADPFPVPGSAMHNNQVVLTATTGLVEAVFLVDASGSMAYTPDGVNPPTPADTRWAKLKTGAAASWALFTGFSTGQGSFALAQFPDITTGAFPAPSPSSKVLVPRGDISTANITAAVNALDAHTPVQNGGATPMGHGLGTAVGNSAADFGLFLGSSDALKFNERFLVLQSDGKNNSAPPDPNFFYPPGDAMEAAGNFFTDKKISVIAVGYGKQGTPFEVDDGLLNTLAANSINGSFLDAFADNMGMALKKQFRQAIVAGLDLDPTIDPGGFLSASQPEVRYEIGVLPYDRKVAFTVDWFTAGAPISVSLVTPLCEVITEKLAPTLPGVFFQANALDRTFVFDNSFLSNAQTPTRPRYGAWTLIITYSSPVVIEVAAAQAPAAEVQYQYEVITESRLKMAVNFDKKTYGAGDKIGISASLSLDGLGISNASVGLSVQAPGQSTDNFIAFTQVSPALLERAAQTLSKEDVTAEGIKSFAIQLQGTPFNAFSNSRNVPMVESGRPGVYQATFDATSVPGTYQFYITATGLTPDGVAFRRERVVNQRVVVIPAPAFTLVNVIYQAGGALVQVFPKDTFGNVILFDPKFNPRIAITATGAELKGPLTFNGDGSYTGTLTYAPTAHPVIQVAVDGTVVVPKFPLQPVANLNWVDTVIDFHPGAQGAPGANTHANAVAVLGNPTTKAADQFVSTGGGGSVTVGIKGRVAVNTGGDDLTVFIQPDTDLRAYRVEASPGGNQWFLLGTSPGVTQSFSLGKLSVASAIRVTDLSGRIRDQNRNPIATPGVSIRAVGITRTAEGDGGGRGDICLRVRALNPAKQPLGGTVSIEFEPQEVGPTVRVEHVDASQDIDVTGLERTPQGLYEVTVTPDDVFKPTSQFVTIPASGFATAVFVIDKTVKH